MNTLIKQLKFDSKGLIPGIVQDAGNGQVLMMAFLNKEAVRMTLKTGLMHYWSRSRKKLWLKGETSGHVQKVKGVFLDCDGDALLFKVVQKKAACHTGFRSCFYRRADAAARSWKAVGRRLFDPKKVYKK